MSVTPDTVRAVINSYVDAWRTNDLDLLLSLFAEDATWEDPVGSTAFQGHEGITKFFKFAQPDGDGRELTPVPLRIIACGNEGILRFIMQVRVPSANQGLNLEVTDHFVLNADGKIQSARAFWDEGCAECPEGMDFFIPDTSTAHD